MAHVDLTPNYRQVLLEENFFDRLLDEINRFTLTFYFGLRVALMTGGTIVIGWACVDRLFANVARVVVTNLKNVEQPEGESKNLQVYVE